MERIFTPFYSLRQSARMVFALALVLTLPVMIIAIQSPKDQRQFAAENTPSPTPSYTVQTATDRSDYALSLINQTDLITKLTNIGAFGQNINSSHGSTNGVPVTTIVIHLTSQPQSETVFIDPTTKQPAVTATTSVSSGKIDVSIAYSQGQLNPTTLNTAARKADYAVFISLYKLTHPVKSVQEVKSRDQALTILLQGLPAQGFFKVMQL